MGIKASSNRIEYTKKSASSSSLNTAPSTPTSPLDVEVEHLETLILVWLDQEVDDNEQNEALQKRLRQYITYLVTFDDWRSCEQWLKARPTDEKILLVVSGGLGKRVVPNLHQLTSIIGIYVFCWKPENYTTWAQSYSKVRAVISKAEALVQQISKDEIYFENIENSKSIKIFKNRPHTCIFDIENTSFICYQLFLEILLSSSYLPSTPSPGELIQILRRYNSNDQYSLNLINEFEQKYDKQKAITWLTNNTPLTRFTNRALREQNISMLFYLRFFLIDIYNQLISHQLPSIHVYRKQIIPLEQIENIRINVNNYLMLNEFLCTTTQPPSELSLIETNDNQLQTVFIEIHAENRDGIVPFAFVQNNDNEQNNSEVLFMCGATFKIVSLTKNINSSWTLQLSLAENKEFDILTDKKQKLRKNKDLLMIVDLFDQCNQLNKANVYCQHLLRELPPDHILVPQIKEKINTNTNPKFQPVSLRCSQFILIDLSTRLTPISSAMLKALCSLTNNSILIRDNYSEIDFNTMINKTIVLFTSSQVMSSMKKTHSQLTHYFILEDNENEVAQPGRFDDSEDLIFQLADELYRYYQWEANDDLRAGDIDGQKEKEEVANRIHNELKKVHQIFSENIKPTISTITTLVWLKSIHDNDNDTTKIQNLFKNIVSSVLIFFDEQECFAHFLTIESDYSAFLIIDNDYRDVSVIGFQQLSNVKKIYRYDQKSSDGNGDNLCLKLIHDLLSHYNELGNEFEDRKDSNNAKDMFLKAHHLCELLIKR